MTSAEISSGIGVRDLLILRLIPPQCLPAKGANGLFAANRSLIPRCSLGIALQWPRMSPLALGGRERASVRRLHSKMNGLGPNGACPFWAAFFFVNAHRGSIWFLSVLSDFRRTKKVLDVRTTRLRRTLATSFVSAPFDRSRILSRTRPASRFTPDAAASTASHPASVTIAIRPCSGTGWREFVEMICPTGEAKYFCKGDSTGKLQRRPPRLGKNSDYRAGVARSVTTANHSAMLAWNAFKTSGIERRAEPRPLSRATRAFSAMYATKRSKPRMLSMRVKL